MRQLNMRVGLSCADPTMHHYRRSTTLPFHMHAGGPDVLKVQEVPIPTPGPQQILVKMEYAGVNPVDT
jgi:NADPH-dependent curcumin reductase CurA